MPRGARPGNRNALKHGYQPSELRAIRRRIRSELAVVQGLLRNISLPGRTGYDFITPDKRGLGAGPPPKTSPREC